MIDIEKIKRLDVLIQQLHDEIDDDPESKEAELLFGPLNELGYAVDQILDPIKKQISSEA